MYRNLIKKTRVQLDKCYQKYRSYASFHEAMSVFREEFEELWQECKKKELNFELIEKEIIDNIVVLVKMYKDIVIEKNKR